MAQAGIYAGERGLRLVAALVAGVVVARVLGPTDLGLLQYEAAVFGLLMPVVALGLPSLLARDLSTRDDAPAVLASVISRQIIVAVGVSAMAFALVAATRGGREGALIAAAAMLPLPLLSISDTLRVYLETRGRARAIVRAGATAALVGAAAKVAVVLAGGGVPGVAAVITLEAALLAAGLAMAFRPGRVARARRLARRELASSLLRESWPLLVASVAVTAYLRIDQVMLGMLADDRETGVYAAAVRLSEVWYFLPVAALAAVRPQLSRLHATARADEYRVLLQRFLSGASVVAGLLVVAVLATGPWVATTLYGADFAETGDVLRLHILSLPFVFLGTAANPWFVDRGLTRAVLYRSVGGAILNVVGNAILIPTAGAHGAALATLVSYAAAGWLLNAASPRTRPVFLLQTRGLLGLGLRRPRQR